MTLALVLLLGVLSRPTIAATATASLTHSARHIHENAMVDTLPTVEVTDSFDRAVRRVRSASQHGITAAEVAERPVGRPGEILEAMPGVLISQHSGEGKANQYYLRGFNLDHGTDFATLETPIEKRGVSIALNAGAAQMLALQADEGRVGLRAKSGRGSTGTSCLNAYQAVCLSPRTHLRPHKGKASPPRAFADLPQMTWAKARAFRWAFPPRTLRVRLSASWPRPGAELPPQTGHPREGAEHH